MSLPLTLASDALARALRQLDAIATIPADAFDAETIRRLTTIVGKLRTKTEALARTGG